MFSCTAAAGAVFSLEGFGLYIYLGIHFRHSVVSRVRNPQEHRIVQTVNLVLNGPERPGALRHQGKRGSERVVKQADFRLLVVGLRSGECARSDSAHLDSDQNAPSASRNWSSGKVLLRLAANKHRHWREGGTRICEEQGKSRGAAPNSKHFCREAYNDSFAACLV